MGSGVSVPATTTNWSPNWTRDDKLESLGGVNDGTTVMVGGVESH